MIIETILIFVFVILEIIKNIIEKSLPFNYTPFKFTTIGMITLSYFYSVKTGLILLFFHILIKMIFLRFDDKTLISIPSLVIILILANVLNNFDYVFIATTLLITRYISDLVLGAIVFNNLNLNKIPGRVINTLISYGIFSFIGIFI